MKRAAVFWVVVLACAGSCSGQTPGERPSDAELAAITERGRALAEYDQAAWHASDAVQTANPKTVEGQHYLARKKDDGRWEVVFGTLNADKSKFLIGYDAQQQTRAKDFVAKKNEPVREDAGFYLFAARALELALADFGGASRPFNAAVLVASDPETQARSGLLYVYLYPAQTKPGVFPLGGDVRYLVSADGTKILVKRPLHKSVLENSPAKDKGKKVVAGFHTHVLSDAPEDTDVLHVLQQDPPKPEYVATRHFVYEIHADGSIVITKVNK